jgi:hypothetical protein
VNVEAFREVLLLGLFKLHCGDSVDAKVVGPRRCVLLVVRLNKQLRGQHSGSDPNSAACAGDKA